MGRRKTGLFGSNGDADRKGVEGYFLFMAMGGVGGSRGPENGADRDTRGGRTRAAKKLVGKEKNEKKKDLFPVDGLGMGELVDG